MDFYQFEQATKALLADDNLDAVIQQFDQFFQAHKIEHGELPADLLQLKGRYNSLMDLRMGGTASPEFLTTTRNQVRDAFIELLSKLRNYLSNLAVQAVQSGRGMLMHNIPRQMPLGTRVACTVRIGAIREELLRDFEQGADTVTLDNVKVGEVMEVKLIPRLGDEAAFRVETQDSTDQILDFDAYSQWQFMVTPLLLGQHELLLKVSVVMEVVGKERRLEKSYEVTVTITTVEELLTAGKQKEALAPLAQWSGLVAVGTALPTHEPSTGGHENATKGAAEQVGAFSLWKKLALLVGLPLAAFLLYKMFKPADGPVDARFKLGSIMEQPTVTLNGKPTDDWAFAAGNQQEIVVSGLIVDSTYDITVSDATMVCKGRATILRKQAVPYRLACEEHILQDNQDTGNTAVDSFSLRLLSKYGVAVLEVDGEQQQIAFTKKATNLFEAVLRLPGGQHRILPITGDSLLACKELVFLLGSDTSLQLDCTRRTVTIPPGTTTDATYTVKLRLTRQAYRTVGGKALVKMDGKTLKIRPELSSDQQFVVFVLKEVKEGKHDFELTNLNNGSSCVPKPGRTIKQDETLEFKCEQAIKTVEMRLVVGPSIAQTMDKVTVIVDGKKMVATVTDSVKGVYLLKGVPKGAHEMKLEVPCYDCYPVKVAADERTVQFSCVFTCIN